MPTTHSTTLDRITTPAPAEPATHFVAYDAVGRRLARAACGRLVDRRRDHANAPTCPECRAARAANDDLTF